MKTLEQIYNEFLGKEIIKPEDDFYTMSYPKYVNFFAQKKQLTKEDIILGMGFVYSWMPTIPKNIKFKMLDEALPILNRAKNCGIVSKEDYINLKSLCNNSLVGASKLLHFINPEQYAIWDRKIYAYLYQERADTNRVEKIDRYMAYLALVNKISQSYLFDSIITIIQTQFKEYISKFRAIEWMFFSYNTFKNDNTI
jgi:hypothetical protein